MVVANSTFTSKVYKHVFRSLEKNALEVIYPGIDLSAYEPLTVKEEKKLEVKLVASYVLAFIEQYKSRTNALVLAERETGSERTRSVDDG